MRIIVVGGGISGLSAAYYALAAGHEVVCLEPGPPGGLVASHRIDGFLCEAGPQAVLDGAPDTAALLEALELDRRAIHASPDARHRFIYVKGRLYPVPMSPPALLTSGLLSPAARLRVLMEPLMFGRQVHADDDDETFLSFGRRRLGAEAARVLLATAAIGIYAGDAGALSVASAFPRLAAMERDHGSLLRGFIASRAGGQRGRPISFPEGLGELPAALARMLGANLWRAAATAIAPASSRTWRVELTTPPQAGPATTVTAGGAPAAPPPSYVDGDVIVVATDGLTAARLMTPLVPETERLKEIPHAPVVVCTLGFRELSSRPVGMKTAGYGLLVARGEKARLLGCQFESSTFAGRAPPDAFLLRALLGGRGPGFEPEIVDQTDEAIVARAVADLREVAGLSRSPDFARVWRHPGGIPQYLPGHMALVKSVNEGLRKRRGLYLIGHALRGVGVNESIRAAQQVVNAVVAAASRGDSRKSASRPTFTDSFPGVPATGIKNG
jgi:oxygen-dependent protoporphyrinogen oxidase